MTKKKENEKKMLLQQKRQIAIERECELFENIRKKRPNSMSEEDIAFLINKIDHIPLYSIERKVQDDWLLSVCVCSAFSNKNAYEYIKKVALANVSRDPCKTLRLSDVCLRISRDSSVFIAKGDAFRFVGNAEDALESYANALESMGEQVPPIDQKERIHYKKYVDKYISSWETAYYRYQYAIESSRFGNKIGSAIFGFLLCKNVLIKQLDEYHVDFVEKRRGLEFLLSIIKNDCGIYRRKGELYKSVKKYDEAVRSYVYAIEILRDAGNSGKIMVERKLCQEGISFCKKEMDKSRCSAKCGFNDVKNGEDYESFVANIIQEAGFICNKTIYTGDQGVDIVVCHKKISVAVQCKFYKNKIGNAAVQEVVAGKKVYGCQKACVVSNACYTSSAKELAKVNRVALLHHSDIVEWLKNVLL